jgi:DNA polymerase I-like protein with 3'-5' exonuclease and polymerase domains
MQTVVLDFETYYDKDFSLSKLTTEEYVRSPLYETIGVSVKVGDSPIRWITGEDDYIRKELEALHLEQCIVVAHNAVFDVAILTWRYGIKPGFIMDTLSLARPIIGLSRSCSLRSLSEYYGIGEKGTEIYNTLGKRRADFTQEELDAFGEYCRQDVNLTAKLLPLLLKETNREELELIDTTIRMFTEPVIELDVPLLEKHLAEVQEKKARLLELVGHEGREAFMSNDKFAELLRAEGVDPPTKISEKTGKEAYAFAKTDDGMRALLEHPNEKVQALASARLGLKSTIEETRTQAFIDIGKRGRMPIQLDYYGAANTGRWSGKGGINPQNLPRGGVLRQSMRAPEGYAVVACDSSNIEVRVEATLAGEENLLKVFRAKGDVYCDFGAQIYGHPITKHDNPEERRISKTAVLGLGYGTGWKKLQSALKNNGTLLSDDECQRIVKVYRSHYSRISALWKACSSALDHMYEGYKDDIGTIHLPVDAKERTIGLPNGLKLRYPDLQRHEGEMGWEYDYQVKRMRKRVYGPYLSENITQALARIVVGYQMLAIRKALDARSKKLNDGKTRQIVHFVHDEVVVVVPEDEQEITMKMMEMIMSRPPAWAPTMPVSCEAGGGKTYGDAK